MGSVGRIFNIERHGLVDGPGIRTVVFFKGCPLQCRWCHNPESQASHNEIMFSQDQCVGCGTCGTVCPQVAISFVKTTGERSHVRDKCAFCGTCVKACPAKALEVVGYEVDVDTLVGEINKGAIFHRRSGGGVTLSGGEPLLQTGFCKDLLESCRKEGIHTALDTCGHAPWETINSIFPLVDLFLYDLKHVDDKKHRYGTGVSNRLILDNLMKLAAQCHDGFPEIIVRIPVIPQFNDTLTEIGDILNFLIQLNGIRHVEILPFHHYGESKYRKLYMGYPFKGCPRSQSKFIEACVELAEKDGFNVLLGE